MAACACNAANALWCAGDAGENSPAACAWAACNAARVGSEAVAAVGMEEQGAADGGAVAGTVALVCVLRWDMRSSLDENRLPHTSLPFIQLQTCAEEDGDETEVGVDAVGADAVEGADREAAEVGSSDEGRSGPEVGGGGGGG